MNKYTLTIETLSPLHIGDGRELLYDVDFVTAGGATYVLNLDRYGEWAYEQSGQAAVAAWMQMKPGDVLYDQDSALETLALHDYKLAGEPKNNRLRSFVKDVYRQPYLPGSSIKGMLRTIFIWGFFTGRQRRPDLMRLGKSRSWAGQPVERSVMGSNPNLDLFRAVRVSDSEPFAEGALRVRSADVHPTSRGGRGGVIVDIEALREEQTTQARLAVDEYGFGGAAADELGWKGKLSWLSVGTLVTLGKAYGEVRLNQEMAHFQAGDDVKSVRGFYRQLVDRFNRLEENQFIAQLGWGTGWNSKTLNDLILHDRRDLVRLARDYRLTRGTVSENTVFPKSRQIVRHQDIPVRPMGWVCVTVG